MMLGHWNSQKDCAQASAWLTELLRGSPAHLAQGAAAPAAGPAATAGRADQEVYRLVQYDDRAQKNAVSIPLRIAVIGSTARGSPKAESLTAQPRMQHPRAQDTPRCLIVAAHRAMTGYSRTSDRYS